jgi:hypothetical protein
MIRGIGPLDDKETQFEAMRRVLKPSNTDPATPERLVREVFKWCCFESHETRTMRTLWLAVLGGRPLYLRTQ